MKLRPYQERATDLVRASYASGHRAPLLQLPTGGGKTVIMAHAIKSAVARGREVLVNVHRSELVTQTVAKLEAAGVTDLRIIQAASDIGNPTAKVAVASIQTLTNWQRDRMPRADLVIFDEAHHVVAKTWATIAGHYADALLLGCTATPQRADGKGLGDIFDDLVIGASVVELTALGCLVPCRVWAAPRKLESAQVVLSPAKAYLEHAAGRRAVVFCCSLEHARTVADEMNAEGIRTDVVHAGLASATRADTLARLNRGGIDAVTNVHVLTEGWDDPSVSVCILARRPQHAGTFLQMVGRVLRPAPGKTHATLIDLCGSVHDHGPPEMEREFSLDGRGIKKVDRDAIRQCLSCGGVFLAGPTHCPMCGCELPRREMALPVEVGGELVDLATLPKLPPRTVTLSITAKYAGWCRACSSPIAVGEQIYWSSGGGKGSARHAECPIRSAAV